MKRLIRAAIAALSFMLVACAPKQGNEKTIAIVVPLEHQAMSEIIRGFKQELALRYHGRVKIIIRNAEHDPMLEHTIIMQLQAQGVDIIEPIGSDALQMTLAQIKSIPVIGIAAKLTTAMRNRHGVNLVTAVDDEISAAEQLKFLQAQLPGLHKLTLIHSADSKIFAEVAQLKQLAAQQGIVIQDLTVTEAADLYTVSQHVAADSQAMFMLKDSLIVSGTPTLAKQAQRLHIPLISSDDGSVKNGAAYALGVYEHEIGEKAADLTAEFLNGKPLKQIPITPLTQLHVFINPQQIIAQAANLQHVINASRKLGYAVVKLSQVSVRGGQ